MPGVHRVEGLGLAFSLLEIEPERAAEIAVHREPAALGVLVGALLLAAGLALSRSFAPAPGNDPDPEAPVLVAGMALLLVLVLVDRGAVLGWSLGVVAGAGRAPLAGAGVLLGSALHRGSRRVPAAAGQEAGGRARGRPGRRAEPRSGWPSC